ncbi:MAG: rane-bound dehydrogenase domain protein [Verrucomicrobiaceae bacterium]|nr:rane-bound dehydrogenase domain protein [Verrucomicrobiaceae bacterium]
MQVRILAFAFVSSLTVWSAEPLKQKINLMDVIKAGEVEYHVNPKAELHDEPKDIWKLEAEQLHISGRGYGYVATKQVFRDYHLVLEFKWGDKTWGKREDKARDNGLLLHAYGPHGAYSDTWMASIEAQIIEGGVGDILVLSPKLADGTELTTSVMSEYTLDRDKEKIWTPGAPRQPVTKGRINWKHRDVDWMDRKGFRGKEDVENALGEWNRLEVIAQGDTLHYYLNGGLVNEAFDCMPSEGRILLQTEGAEMLVRRYELYPLGEFTEKWNPIQASGGSDVPVREGQVAATTPEESQKLIQLDGDYEAQLVASEPLILDPVEVTWDAKGRMYVADMLDYPLGPANPGDRWLSRIVQLTDTDGDGKMDKAVTFAEHVDHVQGLLPYKDGLIATTRSEVLFCKDSDGDGKADVIEPLIKGFNPRHAQLQVSAPRWGLDGCVHFNNGLDAKEIYSTADPKTVVGVPRSNFKWDPRTGKITPTGGVGQYGGAFDDWGHHFYCSNRNPLMFTVMPYEAMIRNPHAGITQNYEDIAPSGAETRVYPLKITHTTADAHAGTNTAACGLGVYRGDLMPELKNNVFVCDPTGQLITRYKVEPNGASLKATRVGKNTEFFRSGDEWCRPVNVTTGPDGALYVCDMYRRYIDHARFFPEEFVKTHDMREGEKQGRIWRIVPKGKKARKIEAAPEKIADLVAWLGHENAWQRETAQRLLAEKPEQKTFSSLFQLAVTADAATKRIQAMWAAFNSASGTDRASLQTSMLRPIAAGLEHKGVSTPNDEEVAHLIRMTSVMGNAEDLLRLAGPRLALGGRSGLEAIVALGDSEVTRLGFDPVHVLDGIVQNRAKAVSNHLSDSWTLAAIASSSPENAGQVAFWFLQKEAEERKTRTAGDYDNARNFIRKMTSMSFASGKEGDIAQLLGILDDPALENTNAHLTWWKPALIQGIAEGLPNSGGKLGVKSLAEFIAKPPAQFTGAAKEIGVLMAQVETTAKDPKAPLDTRLSVLPLLAQNKWDKVQPILKGLLTTTQPPELTAAALALLKKFAIKSTEPFIYELIPHASPSIKGQLVTMLSSGATALELLKRMERGEIPKALMDVEKRWALQRGKGELRDLAVKLFGEPSADRATVIASYMDSTKKPGDAAKGKAVFQTICIACHKIGDIGMEVGPPLADVKAKPPEGLLSDILDPNRMFEARWCAYEIDTKDGKQLSGLVTGETSEAVTLTMMGGLKEIVQRSNIKEMKSLDRSLMPLGLEAGINKDQMTDLLAFLLGR